MLQWFPLRDIVSHEMFLLRGNSLKFASVAYALWWFLHNLELDQTKHIFHVSSLMLQVQYDVTAARLQKWEKIEVR